MTDQNLDCLSPQDVSSYLKAIHTPRDRAIVLLFLTTGIALSEIVEVTVSDIDWKKHTIKVPGKRTRVMPLNSETFDALVQWSQERLDAPTPAFFLTTKGEVKPLETRGIDGLLRRYGASSGLEKTVNAHTLRNTFAIRLFEQPNMTRKMAKQLLGVTDSETIKRFEDVAKHCKTQKKSSHEMPTEVLPTLPDNRSLLSRVLSRITQQQPKLSQVPAEKHAIDPDTLFFGRDHTFADIRASLNKGESILLTGPIGIGKTHLLRRIANHYKVDAFFATSPAPLKAVLLDLIDQLCPEATDKPNSRDPLQDVVYYAIAHKTLSPPILVIDNLQKLRTADIDALIELMDEFTILGATDDDIPRLKTVWWKFKPIPLPPLPDDACEQLVTNLTHHLLVTDPHMLANRIQSLSNGNPLAIVELSKQLRYKPVVTADVIRSLYHEAGITYRDWSIAICVLWGVLVMCRFIALGTHSFEGYILAGFGTSFFLVIKVLLARMK